MVVQDSYDLVLVGGGLQNGLIGLAVLDRCPNARIALVERDPMLGGNHTWCFHAGDLPRSARRYIEPLVVADWPRYEVVFPGMRRVLEQRYAAISSARFHHVVSQRLANASGCQLFAGVTAQRLAPDRVVLSDGRVLTGWVVDARGPTTPGKAAGAGFQKFVGLEVELTGPAPSSHPVVMDATVTQIDGYRFLYVLPLGERRVLFEDTYFADGPELDRAALRARIHAYLAERGLAVAEVIREESGVLPMPWADSFVAADRPPLPAGYRGGWFHPATGYSFPVALRLAELFAAAAPAPPTAAALTALGRRHRGQSRFARLLNWMLFRAVEPSQRWRIYARFYRLPDATIRRFYALQTSPLDRARILVGRPPAGLRWPQPVRAS